MGKATCMKNLPPLPKLTEAYKQESLSSFIYRSGVTVGYDEPWMPQMIFPDRPKVMWGDWLNRIDDPAAIDRISELTLLKSEDIIRMTVHSFAPAISNSQKFCLPNIKAPKNATGKYCPACIDKNPHQQIQWELPYVTSCLEHRCVLIDTCHLCGRKLSGNLVIRGRCSCGASLAEQPPPLSAEQEDVSCQEVIHAMLGLGDLTGTGGSPAFSLPSPEFFILLDVITTNIKYIPQLLECVSQPSPNLYNHGIYRESVRVLRDWPHNYIEFLRNYRQSAKVGYLKTGIERDFAPLIGAMKRRLKDPSFDFLREATEEYLVREWSGGVLTAKITTFPKIAGRSNEQKYVPLAQALQGLRIKRETLIEMAKAGKIDAVVQKVGRNYTQYLIERKAVEELKLEWQDLLSSGQAAEILGIGKRMVDVLAREGILQPKRGKTVDGHPSWLFEERAVKALLAKYRGLGSYNGDLAPGDILPFHETVKYLSFCGVDMPELLRLIDERRLVPVIDPNRTGLAGLMLQRPDLENYIVAYKERRRNDLGMTIQESAGYLGVKDVVVKRWIARGLLPACKNAVRTGNVKIYIPEAVLNKFKQDYLFTEEVAVRLRVAPRTVLDWAGQGKLKACSGPKIDGGRRLLFRARDICG